jgi:fatty acid desaturase
MIIPTNSDTLRFNHFIEHLALVAWLAWPQQYEIPHISHITHTHIHTLASNNVILGISTGEE